MMSDTPLPKRRADDFIIAESLESPGDSNEPTRFHRRLALRVIFAAWTIILLAAFIFAALPPLRGMAVSIVFGPTPIPTATISPQAQHFYFISNLPWGTVSLDGKLLAHVPSLQDKPLQLARGHHIFTFQAEPFTPQSCTISIPTVTSDTCDFSEISSTPDPALVVIFQVSLLQLPPDQQAALIAATRSALQAIQSTETVYPDESYIILQFGRYPTIQHATEQLHATLSFTLDTGSLQDVQCPFALQDCKFSGQNCHHLCSTPDVVPRNNLHQIWSAYGLALPRWSFASSNGQLLAQNQPDGFGGTANSEGLVPFNIEWDGSVWHVTIPAVPAASAVVAPDIGCASAKNTVDIGGLPDPTPSIAGPTPLTWQYTPAPARAQGCLVAVAPDFNVATPTIADTAYLLYRFGSFVTVNALAHQYWPDLPQADSHERSIAVQLGAHM